MAPGTKCNDRGEPPHIDNQPREPRPFCRFLLAEIVTRHKAMLFLPREVAEMPVPTIGIEETQTDGEGGSCATFILPHAAIVQPDSTQERKAVRRGK